MRAVASTTSASLVNETAVEAVGLGLVELPGTGDVGRHGDGQRVDAAPPAIAFQQLRIGGIEAKPHAIGQDFGQRGNVAQAEIKALARNGVDPMRTVADQHQTLCRNLSGMVKAQRVGR